MIGDCVLWWILDSDMFIFSFFSVINIYLIRFIIVLLAESLDLLFKGTRLAAGKFIFKYCQYLQSNFVVYFESHHEFSPNYNQRRQNAKWQSIVYRLKHWFLIIIVYCINVILYILLKTYQNDWFSIKISVWKALCVKKLMKAPVGLFHSFFLLNVYRYSNFLLTNLKNLNCWYKVAQKMLLFNSVYVF